MRYTFVCGPVSGLYGISETRLERQIYYDISMGKKFMRIADRNADLIAVYDFFVTDQNSKSVKVEVISPWVPRIGSKYLFVN